jgi:threonine 3-dehydrogenase
METMRAIVKPVAAAGLEMRDVPIPSVGPHDVLIRVEKTGLCGTDLHIDAWDAWARANVEPPLVIGHEFCGRIVAVGPMVKDFEPGMFVSGEGHVVCGRCRNCMAGRRHLCAATRGVGVNRPGAFAEYISLPDANVWEHAAGIPADIAAIFDPFGNAVHAALQFPLLGEDILITGAGPIGLMCVPVARHAGARHVVITDITEARLDLARRMGATRAVNVTGESLETVQAELGMTEGFDIGLEMSGNASALRQMLDAMCHGGRIAMLGIPPEPFAIDWHQVIFNMLTLRGVYGREMYGTWYQMSVMLQSGLDLDPIITHRLPAADFQQGLAAMRQGHAGKVVLDWTSPAP